MEIIKGYEQISHNQLCDKLDETYKESGKSELELAYEIEVKSVNTARNAFQRDGQIVSDEVLTKVCGVLQLSAFVIWENGQRKYFIKTKNGKN